MRDREPCTSTQNKGHHRHLAISEHQKIHSRDALQMFCVRESLTKISAPPRHERGHESQTYQKALSHKMKGTDCVPQDSQDPRDMTPPLRTLSLKQGHPCRLNYKFAKEGRARKSELCIQTLRASPRDHLGGLQTLQSLAE